MLVMPTASVALPSLLKVTVCGRSCCLPVGRGRVRKWLTGWIGIKTGGNKVEGAENVQLAQSPGGVRSCAGEGIADCTVMDEAADLRGYECRIHPHHEGHCALQDGRSAAGHALPTVIAFAALDQISGKGLPVSVQTVSGEKIASGAFSIDCRDGMESGYLGGGPETKTSYTGVGGVSVRFRTAPRKN